MTSKTNIFINHYTLVNALGRGVQSSLAALQEGRSGLSACDFPGAELETWIGRVAGIEDEPITSSLSHYDCRNNRLAQQALMTDDFCAAVDNAKARYGAHRIGVFVGTSTSGIEATETAYRQRNLQTGRLPTEFDYMTTQNIYSVADYTQKALQLSGPVLAISTACSSSAKVFAAASRYMQTGLCDAAIVGGVDSLCLTTLLGFNSLELVSRRKCQPWDKDRSGINIGEGAGFALLTRERNNSMDIALLGYGESSDAYHMSTPHPEGYGARLAMQSALDMAGLQAQQIDYLNLHGTATRTNDSAEDAAVNHVFGDTVSCSSTKGWTGHTLGAAGITESIFCFLAMTHHFVPQSLNTVALDPQLCAGIAMSQIQKHIRFTMSNSFGFGGSNCSLIFGVSE